MNPTGLVHAARREAVSGRAEARPDNHAAGYPATLRIAKITASSAGVYSAAVLGDNGTVVENVDGLRSVPVSDIGVGDVVWLVYWDGNQHPVIMGGGACACGEHFFQGPSDGGFAGMVEP